MYYFLLEIIITDSDMFSGKMFLSVANIILLMEEIYFIGKWKNQLDKMSKQIECMDKN